MNNIPIELYKEILDKMPICCVDIVLHSDGKVLLLERNDEPEKGKWWVPGGRIYKNETIVNAVHRKVKEETGLDIKIVKFIKVYEYFSTSANFNVKSGTHSIILGYLVEPISKDQKIILDQTSKSYKWIDKIEPELDPYVKRIIEDSQVFQKNKQKMIM